MSQIPKNLRAVKDAHNYQRLGRTILVCLDGTGDQFDSDNSNIVHLVSCLKKDDPSQISYYQSGIGTYNGGGLSNGVSAAVDMAVGSGLGVHIRDAYCFLMQNYKEGDKICLFGFSRGAYTARCLAGMLHKVGLLPAHNTSQVPFAYKFYKDDSPQGWEMSTEFKKTFCTDINVYFIGVFDSVASVGFIPRKLPLSSTPKNRAFYFRHAMGLDEHRAKFKPCRYQRRDSEYTKWTIVAEDHAASPSPVNSGLPQLQQAAPPMSNASTASGTTKDDVDEKQSLHARKKLAKQYNAIHDTDCLEVWFTGCHADVGGGAVKNEVRHKLSNITLRWMIRQCFECDTGILFHTERLVEKGLDVHTLWPTYNRLTRPTGGPSAALMERYKKGTLDAITKRTNVLQLAERTKSSDAEYYNLNVWADDDHQNHVAGWVPEQDEDYFDGLSDINDQLVQAKGWWVLELWPIKVRVQPVDSDTWVKKVRMNLGRKRPVPELNPNLHWTVRQREADADYKIKTRVDRNAEWTVVV